MLRADVRREPVHFARRRATPQWRPFGYVVALVVYLGLALWLTGALGHDIVHHMIWDGPDSSPTVFFLKWWPWAILHGHNPFDVRQLTWPATADAAWLTSVAAPALVGAPVSLILGPIATWNLWILLAPVTAGMATFVLLDTLEVPYLSAVAGGVIFGFSTFVVGAMEHHLFLALVFPIPLLAVLAVRRLRGRIRPAWFVTGTVLLAGFLLYTSTELFATTTLAGLLGCLLLLARCPRAFVETARNLGTEVIAIAVGVALLGAPLAAYALADLGVFNATFQTSSVFSIDLWGYIVPTHTTLLGGSLAASIVQFKVNRTEQIGYLGVVLVVLCLLAIVQGVWQRRWALPFAIWTIVLAVCALGPHLDLRGGASRPPYTQALHLSLPWGVASRLPVLKDALPSRLVVFVFLAVATWAALWTSWPRSPRRRALRALALIAGAILILPNPAGFSWARPPTAPAPVARRLAAWIPPHTGLFVVADWPRRGAFWSEASGFRVDLTGRPWGFNPYHPDYYAWPLSMFATKQLPPAGAAVQLEGFCARHDDGAVAVPDSAPAWIKQLNEQGWSRLRLPGITVYRLPPADLVRYRKITPAQLSVMLHRTEVETLERAGACYLRRGGAIAALKPSTAAARHCLNPAYLGASTTTNWTIYGGWLGAQGGQIGVGVAATGAQASKDFASTPTPEKWLVYDPTAKAVKITALRGLPSATYMAVGPFTSARTP